MISSSSAASAAANKNKRNKAKDPPVLVAEKFRNAMQLESAESAMYSTLDLSAALSTPMQIVYSRNRIRKWIAFDRRVIQACGAKMEFDPETSIQVDSESGRSVVSSYRIAALEFEDTFALNNVLMVRSVKRTMRRVAARTELERRQTDALLLQWTGPHFVGFCTATTTVGSRIDNRMVALPVLDFSFCQLTDVRELLEKPPRDGKEIRDKNVYLHFLAYADAEAKAAEARAKRDEEEEERNRGSTKRDDVIIKAKNRIGDEDHIVIDKNALKAGNRGNTSLDARIELLEDAESVIRDDKSRYACSGLKINNNAIKDASSLEMICRLVIMNAFYFLSWVDLASNQITQVPDMSPFPIVSLYLHDNKITSLDGVKELKKMKLLQNLTLFGNPIQSDIPGKYKLPVLSLLLVDDEAAIQKQHQEQGRKKSESGVLQRAMRQIRLESMPLSKRGPSPASNPRSVSRASAMRTPAPAASPNTSKAAASAAAPAPSPYHGNNDDDDEEAENSKKVVVSPTREKYFPDLPQQPPPPPPPQILRLRTLDHGLITPQDKSALTAWIDMYIKKPVKKKRGHY